MALFTVERFMGDDNEDLVQDNEESAASILNRIKAEAKDRKLRKEKKLHTEIITLEKLEKKKNKRKRKVSLSVDLDIETQGNKSLDISGTEDTQDIVERATDSADNNDVPGNTESCKPKKKKRHESKDTLESETIQDKMEENGSEKTALSPKKKKKRKDKSLCKSVLMNTPSSDNSMIQSSPLSNTEHESHHDINVDSVLGQGLDEGLNDMEDFSGEEIGLDDTNEVGGFTVLGEIRPKTLPKVQRVLPDWLANPSIITVDLKSQTQSVSEIKGIDSDIIQKLKKNNITHFFPVQRQVIPALLDTVQHGFHVGKGGYRPNDLCISAPTGSGKTLAFVLPIVQALKSRVTCQVRALAVLPVRDLAVQVYKVFKTYTEGTKLKVGLLTGQKTFHSEQHSLVTRRLNGYESLVDIIVVTPGRLVDHINKTHGFNLSYLRFLVIDEADRMMEEIKQDWLTLVENAVYSKQSIRTLPGTLNAYSASLMETPLQKLLFSATLSQNPEKLQMLNLFQPKLFTSVVKEDRKNETNRKESQPLDVTSTPRTDIDHSEVKSGDFVGKYTTPEGLTEYYIECTAAEKPLIILHLLHTMKFKHMLCFTNSVESTHRFISQGLHFLLGNKGAHLYNGNSMEYSKCKTIPSCAVKYICNDSRDLQELKQNKDNTSTVKKEYKCEKCNGQYTTVKRLTNHQCRYCNNCLKLFSSYQRLKTHKCSVKDSDDVQKVQENNVFSCEKCKKEYKTKNGFEKHLCTMCDICHKQFSSCQWLKRHKCKVQIESKQSNSMYCEYCRNSYTTDTRLKNHKCAYCKVCQILYSTFQCYTNHICNKKSPECDVNGLANQKKIPESDVNGLAKKKVPESDVNVLANKKKGSESDVNGLANQKKSPESDVNGLARKKKIPKSDVNGLTNKKKSPESDVSGLANKKKSPESDVNGLAKKKAESDVYFLANKKKIYESDVNGLANKKSPESNVSGLANKKKSPESEVSGFAKKKVPESDVNVFANKKKSYKSDVNVLANQKKKVPESDVNGLANKKKSPESDVNGLARKKKVPESDVNVLANKKKSPESDVNGLANQKKSPESDVKGLARKKKIPKSDVNVLANKKKGPESDVNDLANKKKSPESDVNGLANQKKSPESDFNGLARKKKIPKSDVNVLANKKKGPESDVNVLANKKKNPESDVNGLANQKKSPESDFNGLARKKKIPKSDVNVLANKKKSPESDVNGLANQKKSPESDVKGLARKKKIPKSDVNVLANKKKGPESDVNDLANKKKSPESDVNGLANQKKSPESDFNGLARKKKIPKPDVNVLANKKKGPESDVNVLANKKKNPESDVNGLANQKKSPESDFNGLARKKKIPKSDVNVLANKNKGPESDVNVLANKKRPESDVSGLANQKKSPESDFNGLARKKNIPKSDVNVLANKKKSYKYDVNVFANKKKGPESEVANVLANRPIFKPVDLMWQMRKCQEFKLKVFEPSMPLFVRSGIEIIGGPKDIKYILPDGNCFFRALSYVVTGTETNHLYIRNMVVNHILLLGQKICSVLPSNVTPQNYVTQSKMIQDKVWATQVEIFSAAHLLRTDIFVYSQYGSSLQWLKHSGSFIDGGVQLDGKAIYLQHTNNNHYDVVNSLTLRSDDNGERMERKQYMTDYKRKQRTDPNYIWHEQQYKREKRKDPSYVSHEQECMRKKRQNPNYARHEHEYKRKKKQDPNYVSHKLECIRKKRQDPNYVRHEHEYKRKKRQDPNYVSHELDCIRKKRQDPNYVSHEQEYKRKKRQDPNYVSHEQEYKQKKRQDPNYVSHELDCIRKKRQDPNYVSHEQEYKRKKRQDPNYVSHELECIRKKRQDPNYIKYENEHKKKRRSDPEYRKKEQLADSVRKQNDFKSASNIQELISVFHRSVSGGCNYVCTCCEQLWFKESVVTISRVKKVQDPLYSQCVRGKTSFDGKEYLCHTCCASMLKEKLPSLAVNNKMAFPSKPDELELNSLEERLVAPILTFFQIRELPCGGQLGIQGNVVNVPADNISTVRRLPRHLPDTQTIPVKLKRRLRYKSHYMFENIRPVKCVDATKLLLTKPLFAEHVPEGLDETWLTSHIKSVSDSEWNVFVDTSDKCTTDSDKEQNGSNGQKDNQNEKTDEKHDVKSVKEQQSQDDENWSEDELIEGQDECDGVYDTMLYPEEVDNQQNILSFAPSEGNSPVSSLSDVVEELSFPTIFCGEKRPDNKDRSVPVKYSEICRSELRREDRRCAHNIANIFFKAKKLQMKQIQDKVWLSMRRVKTKGKVLTAKDMRNQDVVNQLVKLDDGFRIFRTLRGSPPYWESTKRDLFAMVRQLGLPTWFISLSAAETRWKPLLQCLGRIVDKTDYTDEDIDCMSWQTKCRLLRSDPVTCALYFDYRVKKMFHDFLSSSLNPLGNVIEMFHRIEFQQRGSPHVHAVLWVDGAPELNRNDDKEIEDFVDRYVSTDRQLIEKDNTVEDLVKLQCHRHTHTCRKKNSKCRFNFPLPPMRQTKLCHPLPSTMNVTEKRLHKEQYAKIQKELGNKTTMDMSFDGFLSRLDMTEEQCTLAISSSLKDSKVFLKRDPACIRVNGYNDCVLRAWMANMDIQFITNPYACLMYILNYVSKGQRGMSNLLRRACEEAKKGNGDIRDQVRAVGNKFLKHVEISAQEAVFITLQLKLKNSTCGHIFINTSTPEERPFIVKPVEQLEKLSDNSTNIQCSNVIARYSKRPKQIEKMCLADFSAWYDMISSKKTQTTEEMEDTDNENSLCSEDDICESDVLGLEEVEKPKTIEYRNGVVLRCRKKKKIIRYVRYSKEKDPENYYREQLLLFMPWRQECNIKLPFETYEEKYTSVHLDIAVNREKYEHYSEELENAEKDIENELSEEAYDDVAPNTEHIELQHRLDSEQNRVDLEMNGENVFTEHDIGEELNMAGCGVVEEQLRNRLSDTEFRCLARSLNKKQTEFFYHVLKKAKTSSDQLLLFLSGGAGVGKTRLIKCLHQALLKYYNTVSGENPEQTSVLLTAPTGKAAYLIKGTTLHTAFLIPANQGFSYRPLKSDTLNTMRHRMEKLKFVIIDEISMCGSNLFCFINQRLQEIMGSSKPFGGVNVLAVGDLFQLKPVMDSWIFKQPSGNGTEVLSSNIWTERFLLFELLDVMRQKDDIQFAHLLNRIREGKHSKEDIQSLKLRMIKTDDPAYPVNATHLLYYNKNVDAFNNNLFYKSQFEKETVPSVDIVIGDVSESVKNDVKAKVKETEMGLSKVCAVAVGLRCELTVNVDINDGLVNGAGGIVKMIEYNNNKTPVLIWMNFDDEDVGRSLRNEYKTKRKSTTNTWTPIKKISREFPVGRYKNIKVSRTQFPLRLAAAKTVHRSQGDTLDEVVIELPNRKQCHMHYVAFSRAQKVEQMFIIGSLNEDKITVSAEVKAEMTRLRNNRQMQLCYTPVYTLEESYFKICFLNSQSLHLHIEDVRADQNMCSSDVCMFVETRLCQKNSNDSFSLPDHELYRNDFKPGSNPYGSAIYYRDSLKPHNRRLNYRNIEVTLLQLEFIQIACWYSRPKETTDMIIIALTDLLSEINQNIPMAIMGDFNCDIHKVEKSAKTKRLLQFMTSCGFRQLINDYTTDGHTSIDLIFTNLKQEEIRYGVLESYFSYHKPLWLAVQI